MRFFGKLDPCLSCKLPDCDFHSRFCGLRRAATRYTVMRAKKAAPPPEISAGRALWALYHRIEQAAASSDEARA